MVLQGAVGLDLIPLSLAADLPCKTAGSGHPTGFLASCDRSTQRMEYLAGSCSSGMVLGPGMALLTASLASRCACGHRHN